MTAADEARAEALDIDAIKARYEHWTITPGRWMARSDGAIVRVAFSTGEQKSVVAYSAGKTDAEFIAHARQDVPVLVTEVERLTAQLQAAQALADEAEAQLAHIGAGCVGASREELVKRITAVGTERHKVAHWLGSKLRAAKAEALRETADAAGEAWVHGSWNLTMDTGQWLRDRAASIEQAEATK